MNIKEEGKYYASMVRKYRTEYKINNLQGFCRDQKVSYNKMLHCLRNDSYCKPKAIEAESDIEPGLHPLVIDRVEPQTSHIAEEQQESTPVDMMLDDIDLSFGSQVSLHIGSCSKSALVSLIKEMEDALC